MRLSLAYLALPAVAFLIAWVRPAVAVPSAGGLLVAAVVALRRRNDDSVAQRRVLGLDLTLVASVVLVLGLLSGAGGVGFQRVDWYKHNAILDDLATRPWPVVYDQVLDVSPAVLAYGLGYYLPAAVVGRTTGILGGHMALLAWTVIGLGLVVAWVVRLSGRNPLVALCAWLAFSGMDVLGMALLGGHPDDTMQWWAGFCQYSSVPTSLFWTPQHALAGWLAAALVVDGGERRRGPAAIALALALTVLWSPFAAFGLLPLAVAAVLQGRPRWPDLMLAAVTTAPFALVATAYLVGGKPTVPAGWVWQSLGAGRGLGLWALFVAVEVAVPLAVTGWWWWRRRGPGAERWWWLAAGVTLVLLPGSYIGINNDLAMRASVPSLLVLFLLVVRLPWGRDLVAAAPRATRLLALSLALGAVQPAADLANQVIWSRGTEAPGQPPLMLTLQDLPELIQLQYVSALDGPWARWLAPRSLRNLTVGHATQPGVKER